MALMNWINDWNNIIRDVIFADSELLSLMKVPANTSIIDFIDRYFIKAGYTNKILRDEDVRIVYSDMSISETDVPNIRKSEISFDIYVKLSELHNVGNDRLMMRTQLIANRLIHILSGGKRINGYRFWPSGDFDLGTRTTGYARYNVSFRYMKVY